MPDMCDGSDFTDLIGSLDPASLSWTQIQSRHQKVEIHPSTPLVFSSSAIPWGITDNLVDMAELFMWTVTFDKVSLFSEQKHNSQKVQKSFMTEFMKKSQSQLKWGLEEGFHMALDATSFFSGKKSLRINNKLKMEVPSTFKLSTDLCL